MSNIKQMTFEEKIEAIYFYKERKGSIEYWYNKDPENIKGTMNIIKEHMKKGGVEFDGNLTTIEHFIEQLLDSIGETGTYTYGIYHENDHSEIVNYCYFIHQRKFTKDEFEMMYNKARQACEDDWGIEYPSLAGLWQKMHDIYGFDLYNPDVVLLYLDAYDDEHIRIKVDEIYNQENHWINDIVNKIVKDANQNNETRRDHVNDFLLDHIGSAWEKILDEAMKQIEENNTIKEREINDTIDQFFNEMSEKYNIKFDGFDHINNLWKYNK